uniref:2-C-methyl-D-erythritol 4-phosphate cytidylyltransferase n=1 Tax=Timema poppense TaxID=170557 RepID=A0A7R9D747_TIMPO|nr:unnamed protein product [Timema poppensis]
MLGHIMYLIFQGKPLFLYAVEEFLQLPYVATIVLVVDDVEKVLGILGEFSIDRNKVLVVSGELTRHRSIRAGLQALHKKESPVHVVVVHDAVRPIVPAGLVEELVLAADRHGAAGFTRPLVSTVVRGGEDGFLEHTLDRATHFASETPQAFQFNILTSAFSKSSEEDLDTGTECLHLVLSYVGVKALLIPGPEQLWKVTHKKDIYAALGCLKERIQQVCIVAAEESDVVKRLCETLRCHVVHVKSFGDSPRGTFNTVVLFHIQQLDHDTQLLDLAAMLDFHKQGLIIHIIKHTSADGTLDKSVYDLHQSGRNMSEQYKKFNKGVVIIHHLTPGEDIKLADLVMNLILSDPNTFSGQTMIL